MGKAGILHCRLDRCEPGVAGVAPSRPSYNQRLMKPVQSRPGINAIVFDIGWVLVRLDYSPLTTYLKDHGADISSMRDVTSRIGLEQHETGTLAGEELLENLARLGSRPMSQPELRRRWLNMFEPQEPMLALARSSRKSVPRALAEQCRRVALGSHGAGVRVGSHWARHLDLVRGRGDETSYTDLCRGRAPFRARAFIDGLHR